MEKSKKQKSQLEAILPLTGMQEGMLYHKLLNPESSEYVIQTILSIKSHVSEEILRQSFDILMKKHQALRTSIVHKEVSQPRQVVFKERTLAFIVLDLSDRDTSEEVLQEIYKQDVSRGFDLEEDPLMRITLVKRSTEDYRLVMSYHHIIMDGWCASIIMNDFLSFYVQLSMGQSEIEILNQFPKQKQYSDYIRCFGSKGKESGQLYWEDLLEGYEGEGSIAPLGLIDEEVEGSMGIFRSYLTEEETIKLEELAQNYDVTLNTIVEAAWGILLGRYNRVQDVVFGKVVSGRNVDLPGIEEMVGLFINTIPVRVTLDDELTFGGLITDLQKQALRSGEHDHYALAEIQKLSGLGSQLIQNTLVFENYYVQEAVAEAEEHPLKFQVESAREETSYDLSLNVYKSNQLTIGLRYKSNKYGESEIQNILEKLKAIMRAALIEPEKKVLEIETMVEAERTLILSDFNDTYVDYPRDKTVVQLFEEQVEKTPDHIALVFEGESLTYKALNEKVNALAHKLRALGVKPDDYVGIMTERSVQMIVGIYGIIKAGGAYVPIDPAYPEERIQYMLEDCQPKVILTCLSKIEAQVPIIDLGEAETWEGVSVNPIQVNKSNDLIYLIYTSGTTGKPKGVMIQHCGTVNLVKNYIHRVYEGSRIQKVLLVSPYVFDMSVKNIFGSLLYGATLHISDEEMRLNIRKMYAYINENHIDLIDCTPQHLKMLSEIKFKEIALKAVLVGGEKLGVGLVRRFENHFEIHNGYGPTEGSVNVTWHPCSKQDAQDIPIGPPIPNTQIYIMNGDLLCGIGIPGELCLAGVGIARGYLNQPELTAERFVDNPYGSPHSGGKLYRTGDLARWLPNGKIAYIGRIDEQVKIRGFRIELGEIGNAMRVLEEIKDCAVIARENSSGEQAIHAYVVSDIEVSMSSVRDQLEKLLPDYMIPSYMAQIDAIPITRNGKLDKRALPEIKTRTEKEYVRPRNEIEEALCLVFKEILGTDSVIGIDDSFFGLGGDSIKAMRIVSKLREKGYQTDVRSIMQNKTPRGIGEAIKEIEEVSIDQGEIVGEVALTPIQRDFILNDDKQMHHYNQSMMLESQVRINQDILMKALNKLVQHHDMLRAMYEGTRQKIKPFKENEGFDLYVHDYRDIADEVQLAKEMDCASNDIQRSINLGTGPLFKVGLFQTQTKDYLLLSIHHLVVDGVSWRILTEDFTTSYQLLENGQQVSLPQKTNAFREWSGALEHYLESERLRREIPYWKEVETDIERGNMMPISNERSRVEILNIVLSEAQTAQLLYEAPQVYHAELNDILLTSIARGIASVTDNQIVSLNMEGHGREDIGEDLAIDRTVGWFTSVYPVVIKEINGTIERDIQQVKETLRRIPNYGIGYGVLKSLGEKILEGIQPTVTFNYLGEFVANEQDGCFTTSQIFSRNDVSEESTFGTKIAINSMIAEGMLNIVMIYDASQYSNDLMDNLQQEINKQLEDVLAHCLSITSPEHTASDFGELKWSHEAFKGVKEKFTNQGYQLETILPLTRTQEGMLYHKLLSPESSQYVNQITWSIKNFVSEKRLRQSFEMLMKKHQALRISIVHKNVNEPRQVVLKERALTFSVVDLSDEEVSEEALQGIYKQDVLRGFDLEEDPLMRITLVKLSAEDSRLVMSIHHIIEDGWCTSIIMNDFLTFYAQLSEGQSETQILSQLPKQKEYSDYIRYMSVKENESSQLYWENLLEGYEGEGAIPPLRVVDEEVEESVSVFKRFLTEEETIRLEELAQNYHVTINTVLEAAWGILLGRYNHQKDIVFGKVVSGRNVDLAGIEEMIGLFINTIPIRVTLDDELTFGELIKQLQEQALRSEVHDHYGTTEIQKLIQTTLTFENFYIKESDAGAHPLEVQMESNREEMSYDLSLFAYKPDQLILRLMYNPSKYEKSEVQNILEKLMVILRTILIEPQKKVLEIEAIMEEERTLILSEFNYTDATYPKDKTVVQLFEEQVEKTPENIAVIFEDKQLTYKELNARVNALAHKLRDLGVGPDDYVCIISERSLEMIIGIYGIIKAGGAYVPVDPMHPKERINYILEDCHSKVVLTYQTEVETSIPIINLEETETWEGVSENPIHVNKPGDLLYCIYTSGTTGKPKGVMIEHNGLINRIIWMQNRYPLNEYDVILQKTMYTFDVSVWEILWWSFVGAKVVMLKPKGEKDPDTIIQAIKKYEVTTMHFVPSMLKVFTEYTKDKYTDHLMTLKYVFASGEALMPYHVHEFNETVKIKNKKVSLINVYGPTEASIDVTYFDCEDNHDIVPIGRPISNTQIYIIDHGMLCGIGIPGELYIAGDGLARGYLNRPELTAEKFVDNPYGEGKLYRSGDLARWLPDGNIEYLGRIDQQVKIRGFRIELGEIESTIRAMEEIKDCAVIARVDGSKEQAIYGYVVSDIEVCISSIKNQLENLLPDYMIPAYMIQIDSIPVTRNGKLDKRALPEIDVRIKREYVSPRTEVEEALCLVFQEILGIDSSIGIDDSFFVLGGDSIKAIRIVSKLRERGYQTNIRSIMQGKTPRKIGEMAEKIKEVLIVQREVEGEVILTPIQKDFILNNNEQMYHFNQSMMLESQVKLDEGILRSVLNELVRHHDMLRATYYGQRQEVKPYNQDQDFDLYIYDYEDIADEEQLAKEIETASNDIQTSINLETGPIFKVGLFRSQIKDYLLLCSHHLVVDDVSWRIISEDFTTCYQLIEKGKRTILPQKTTSFQAWSQTLDRYLKSDRFKKELPYWKEVEENIESGNITVNGDRGKARPELLRIELSEEHTSQLLYEAPQAYQAEFNDLLLAAVVQGIARATDKEMVSIYMESHERKAIGEDVVTDRTVGCFTSVYPLVIKNLNENIESTLYEVKETLHQVPNHGMGYRLLKSLGKKVLEGIIPTIKFNYLGEFSSTEKEEPFISTRFYRSNDISEDNIFGTDISINSVIAKEKLRLTISYDAVKYTSDLMYHVHQEIQKQLEAIRSHCLSVIESKNEEVDEIQKLISGDLSLTESLILGDIENKYEPSVFQSYFLNKEQAMIISDQLLIEGNIEKEEIIRAVTKVIEKSEALRSSYQKQGGKYVICEHTLASETTIPYLDLRYTSQSTRAEISKVIDYLEIWRNCFIKGSCLSKFLVLREADDRYIVVFKVHHVVWDGMSSVLLKEKIHACMKGQEYKSSLPYSHYVATLNQEVDDQCQKIKTQFLSGLEAYHKGLENNPIIGSEISVVKLPKNLDNLNHYHNIWDLLIYIATIISKENKLSGEKIKTIPIQILQENRNKTNLDYSESLGLFIDLAPLLIDLDHVKDNNAVSTRVHELDVLKRANNIDWIDLFRDINLLDTVLIINYTGSYEKNFDRIKKTMLADFNIKTREITISLYDHHLIIHHPVFKKNSGKIEQVLQEKINEYLKF